jgi:hypothetical protein
MPNGETRNRVSPALAMAQSARADPLVRDHLIAAAVAQGDSVAAVAQHLALSRQQVHAILERVSRAPALSPEAARAESETASALLGMTDHVRFEELVHVLLNDIDPTIRPLGGVGDRARDAVADLAFGDGAIVSISLEREWTRKIRREIVRMADFGYRPPRVYGVTNRRTTRDAEHRLEQFARDSGITLRVLGQQWLVAKLLHPDYLELRCRFLGLSPTRPKAFLAPDDYRRLLNGRPGNLGLDVPMVGRAGNLRDVLDDVGRCGCLVLEGAGGVGKTRLLLEAAEHDGGARAWRFLDESTPVGPEALGELDGGDDLVVVVDNAHRRRDLPAVLALLERRHPKPDVVFVARSHQLDEIRRAASRVWLGAPNADNVIPLRLLTRRDIAEIVKSEPFGIPYGGTVANIVDLAEGNPLIAVLAATLARDGRSVPELTRDEVFKGHVAGLLATVTENSPDDRQLRELLAITAALGGVQADDERITAPFSDLLGFGPAALRRWLGELADRGLLVATDENRFTVKPDLLADYIVVSSFFSPRWRPVLAYEKVLDSFAGSHLLSLCRALGRIPVGELDTDHRGVRALQDRLRPIVVRGPLERASHLVLELLPGAENLAIPALRTLIERVAASPDQVTKRAAEHLVAATQRITADIAASWRLLLEVAAAGAGTPTFDVARDAMHEIYKRVPVDVSDQDGRILADTQRALADVTEAFTRKARAEPAHRAAAAAGQALLVVTFEETMWSVDHPRTLAIQHLALPGSDNTRNVLKTGVGTLLETLLRVPPADQLRSLEAALSLARRAAGFRGGHRIELDPDARASAAEALGLLDELLRDRFDELSLPVQAEALSYLLWRREWVGRLPEAGKPAASGGMPEHSGVLDEYRLLVHCPAGPPNDDSWQDERRALDARCAQLARQLVADPAWEARLGRWESWLGQAHGLFDFTNDGHQIAAVLAQAAELRPRFGVDLIDELVATGSTLRTLASSAVYRLGAAEQLDATVLGRWCAADDETRAMVAAGIADLDGDLAEAMLRRLADDPSERVRRGVLRGLNYGKRSTPWRIRLGLGIAGQLADAEALYHMLLIAEWSSIPLAGSLVDAARKALLGTAAAERVRSRYLIRALDALSPATGDLTLAWVWERLDWLKALCPATRDVDVLPDELAPRVRARASDADLLRVLVTFESASRSSLVSAATIDLLQWIDPGSAAITDAIVRHRDDPLEGWRVYRLLSLRELSWDECEQRALDLAERLRDADIVSELVHAMLPRFWSGSRIPQLESALAHLETWRDRPATPAFHRAVDEIAEEVRRMILGDRDRERRQDELAGLS